MKNFEELSNFVKNNPDWLDKLKPYLKSSHECDYNTDWVKVMYNLFNIPADPEIYKIICECRGTMVNKKTGEIICAPFVKFWNYGEERADKNINWKKAYYSHKRDGWLALCFKHEESIYITTSGMYLSKKNRGALVDSTILSEYNFKDIADVYLYCLGAEGFNDNGSVKWATTPKWVEQMQNGDTAMFELESPCNVVHTHLVDSPKLWLIGYRNYKGDELNIWEDVDFMPFDTPKLYNFNSAEQLLSELKKWKTNEEGEGVVVLSIDENNNFHRVKIKCEDYLKVKYAENSSNISDNDLFQLMLNGEVDDLLAANPSLSTRIDIIKEKLENFKNEVYCVNNYVTELMKTYKTKKDLVLYLKKYNPEQFGFILNCITPTAYIEKQIDSWKKKKHGFDELCNLIK